jgi:hypothetical protein
MIKIRMTSQQERMHGHFTVLDVECQTHRVTIDGIGGCASHID